ncbi:MULTISPECIES: MarR family transcriptional regulator [unclassified Enterococcus]|uniref:MarR family winged helix-turn-helix transcriptional regulator n=1 Tax=unclassified Enterococcus TaxID=2608891 RepID=UPI0015551C9B|nr:MULTISPECIES: MarR family transcriptional regulator [unclassified Enterococcus]MBS7576391.1 MarR family transcriptional regulator [Enterococcus sp. MMGLQ5-2]MBS7583623.1 MarR family transcriptional regulator [Enterococcus sp. MMGLQ5-1]NPD11484.1 MarR family transcriptional regulator [Enterococcus sp. MMGLQ5-1]NPD36228.1 MarR family transcriptional regulator [Enterococcus sp. MMGLQ5-2]
MDIKETIDKSYHIWFGMNSVYENWAKKQHLTNNSLMTLYVISNLGEETTPKQIIERLQLPKQTVNSMLNTLEKKGYLYREQDAQNKRQKMVKLTESGKNFTDKVLLALYQFEYQAYAQLTAEERKMLIKINEKLLDHLTI